MVQMMQIRNGMNGLWFCPCRCRRSSICSSLLCDRRVCSDLPFNAAASEALQLPLNWPVVWKRVSKTPKSASAYLRAAVQLREQARQDHTSPRIPLIQPSAQPPIPQSFLVPVPPNVPDETSLVTTAPLPSRRN